MNKLLIVLLLLIGLSMSYAIRPKCKPNYNDIGSDYVGGGGSGKNGAGVGDGRSKDPTLLPPGSGGNVLGDSNYSPPERGQGDGGVRSYGGGDVLGDGNFSPPYGGQGAGRSQNYGYGYGYSY